MRDVFLQSLQPNPATGGQRLVTALKQKTYGKYILNLLQNGTGNQFKSNQIMYSENRKWVKIISQNGKIIGQFPTYE